MTIVICDDDRDEVQKIMGSCQQLCEQRDEIYTYTDSTKLYHWLMSSKWKVDLFILDVEMPQLDGIELKRQISKMSIDTHIAFLTNHRESIDAAFGRYVVGFLDKNDYEERLRSIIAEIRDELCNTDIVNIPELGEIRSFRQKEIIKIEAHHVYTRVEMLQYYDQSMSQWVTEYSEHRISLKEWEKYLDCDTFYRISRSLIINLYCVKRINNYNELEFMNGERYEVPIKKRKAVRTAYNQYCMRKARCM